MRTCRTAEGKRMESGDPTGEGKRMESEDRTGECKGMELQTGLRIGGGQEWRRRFGRTGLEAVDILESIRYIVSYFII